MTQQPMLYHGDEFEVDGDEVAWATKKYLRIVRHSGGFDWLWLSFFLELKVDNPETQSFAGIFIDEAEEPEIEIPVSATEYELFERGFDITKWELGTHLIEVKLKSEGGKIYNRLFEIYTVPPLPIGAIVKIF